MNYYKILKWNWNKIMKTTIKNKMKTKKMKKIKKTKTSKKTN